MKSLYTTLSLLVLLSFSACGSSGGDSAPTSLQFSARVGNEPYRCGTFFENLGSTQTRAEINDFRFYVSDLALIRADGELVSVELVEDGLWQRQNTALLDFEDATGGCSELGTEAVNDTVNFTVPAGDYTGVEFTLGIPFELNHQDVSVAASPFNIGAMQWSWRAGFKFLRIDLKSESEAGVVPWNIHLGSTGCQASSAAFAPIAECSRSNRPRIRIENFDSNNQVVVADASSLVQGNDISSNTPNTAPGCMSGPTDPECPSFFPNFGLSLENGECLENCRNQSFFYAG